MKPATICFCLLVLGSLNACDVFRKPNTKVVSFPMNNVVQQTKQDNRPQAFYTQTTKQNPHQVQTIPIHVKQEVDKAIELTNQLRAAKKLPPLKYNPHLAAYAQVRAQELIQQFSHKRPDGQSYGNALQGGFRGENIAAGSKTAAGTVRQWRDSRGHYESIINPNYTMIGIGMVIAPNTKYGYYWAQIFGDEQTTTPYFFAKPVSDFRQPTNSNRQTQTR